MFFALLKFTVKLRLYLKQIACFFKQREYILQYCPLNVVRDRYILPFLHTLLVNISTKICTENFFLFSRRKHLILAYKFRL